MPSHRRALLSSRSKTERNRRREMKRRRGAEHDPTRAECWSTSRATSHESCAPHGPVQNGRARSSIYPTRAHCDRVAPHESCPVSALESCAAHGPVQNGRVRSSIYPTRAHCDRVAPHESCRVRRQF